MTDKVQKIREEVERLKRWNDNVRESTRHMTLQEEDFNRGKHSSYLEILNFIDSMQEEPVSGELGDYINELSKQFPEVSFAKLSRIAVRVAQWQKEQDQSTIELAEDHAMLAGMEKMKEQIMAKAKGGTVQKDYQIIMDDGTYIDLDPSMQLKPSFVGLKEGDRIKVIVIKED